jgi:hypothetical protein
VELGGQLSGRTSDFGYATVNAFIAGYNDAYGPPQYLDRLLYRTIPCEYGGGDFVRAWRPYDHANPNYYSRAQFHPDSWARAGGGDPYNDYDVGRNVANWLNRISEPGGSGGWPVCWWT